MIDLDIRERDQLSSQMQAPGESASLYALPNKLRETIVLLKSKQISLDMSPHSLLLLQGNSSFTGQHINYSLGSFGSASLYALPLSSVILCTSKQ